MNRKLFTTIFVTILSEKAGTAFDLSLLRAFKSSSSSLSSRRVAVVIPKSSILCVSPESTSLRGRDTQLLLRVDRGGGDGSSPSKQTTLSYYLIWSKSMFSRTVATFATLMALRWSVGDRLTTISTGSVIARRILDTIILPLLSSACCGIQVLMNVLAIGGCAGFNKYLGPLRPYFLGMLMSVVVMSYTSVGPIRLTAQLLLAFLPELVHLSNELYPRYRQLNIVSSHTAPIPQPSLSSQVVELVIPNMGCVACIQKINSSLRRVPGVIGTKAWLEESGGGKAKVEYRMKSHQDADDVVSRQGMIAQFVRAVYDAGFDADPMDSTIH